jgi:hypothetical protein
VSNAALDSAREDIMASEAGREGSLDSAGADVTTTRTEAVPDAERTNSSCLEVLCDTALDSAREDIMASDAGREGSLDSGSVDVTGRAASCAPAPAGTIDS